MVGNKEYDYDIDANTGKILSKDFDLENVDTSTSKSAVSKDQAKEIAVKDAGFAVNDVTFKKVKQELDDGIEKIKVEFIQGETEYEYEIDANSGAILERSTDSVYDD
ncbi:MAG: PepSY domain-containing protein [Faecalicoccus sp.]|nr:PepSY domain-containing protein [Faecalicoccus sp.]